MQEKTKSAISNILVEAGVKLVGKEVRHSRPV